MAGYHAKNKNRKRPPEGLESRDAAVDVLSQVLSDQKPFDLVLAQLHEADSLSEPRDQAFVRALTAAVLRHKGQMDAVFSSFLNYPLRGKTGKFHYIMLVAITQILYFQKPLHAVANIAVFQCRRDRKSRHLDKLATAILRRVADAGPALLAEQDAAKLNTPDWLWKRWEHTYGPRTRRAIAAANQREASLDLSVKADAEEWAKRLGARHLPTGTLRLQHKGRIEDIEGYGDGAWWMQDAASALPAQLLEELRGARVADLCAAPGGKTAQLATAGADVTAIDVSAARLMRLSGNLARLNLHADIVCADILEYEPVEPFDGILLDAPCTATGTIRRHPDLPYLKSEADVAELAAVQRKMLDRCTGWLKPGGTLIYCTCSLEPEEGETQIRNFLASREDVRLQAIDGGALQIPQEWLTDDGMLRTLPCHAPDPERPEDGLDGFFAACLIKV